MGVDQGTTNESASANGWTRWHTLVVGLLIAVHVLLAAHTAWSKSVTHDEYWHLPVGLINLSTGDMAADDLNPPLTRMWAALPLWVTGVAAEVRETPTATGDAFLAAARDAYRQRYFIARLFNVAFSVATALLIVEWARRLWGPFAAIVSVALYALSPNVIAHAGLVTPDLGLTCFTVLSFRLFAAWNDKPSWKMAMGWGVALGLAQASKFTAVLLVPLFVVGAVVVAFRRPERWQLAAKATTGLLVALFVLNLMYGFAGTGTSLAGYQFQSQVLLRWREALPGFVHVLPLPFPKTFIAGIDHQRAVMEQPHPNFLDEFWAPKGEGFPIYYLRALQYKLPHVTQTLVILGTLIMTVRLWRRRREQESVSGELFLYIGFAGLLLLIASLSTMQLGLRYLLPIFPLLFLVAGVVLSPLRATSRVTQWGVTLLLVACAAPSLRHHPHHLAYFNEAAGGPLGGRHHLIDSNLDWGQDLWLLRDYLRENEIETIGLAYFGTVPPGLLGINYTVAPSWFAEPGLYAVSVNFVQGRPHTVTYPDGTRQPVSLREFNYFRQFRRVANLGGSIDIYRVAGSTGEE